MRQGAKPGLCLKGKAFNILKETDALHLSMCVVSNSRFTSV